MRNQILKAVSQKIHQILNNKKEAPNLKKKNVQRRQRISQTQGRFKRADNQKKAAEMQKKEKDSEEGKRQAQNLYEKKLQREEWNRFDFDKMDGEAFEYFCARLLCANGFQDVELTKRTGDLGVDILAQKDQITYAIQCKCHTSNIGNQAVRDVYSGKECYHRMIGVVMTNRFFTKAAKKLALEHNILLWDRYHMDQLVRNARRYVYEIGKDFMQGEYWIFGKKGQRWRAVVAQDFDGKSILFQVTSEGSYIVEVKTKEYLILEEAYLQPVTSRQYVWENNGWFAVKAGRELEAGEYQLFTADEEVSGYYAIYKSARYIDSEKVQSDFFENGIFVELKEGMYLLGENCYLEKV